MNAWEESRQQIAIFGWITEKETQKPLAGVQVRITKKPQMFADMLALIEAPYGAKWRQISKRPDQTVTAEDGSFYFIDIPLPEGSYTLSAALPDAGLRYSKTEESFEITRGTKGKIKITPPSPINLALSATSIKGRIIQKLESKKNKKKPIAMAEIEVLGSGERVYSNGEGGFLLTGIEPRASGENKGKREIQVTAPGYQKCIVQTKTLSEAGAVEDLNDIELK